MKKMNLIALLLASLVLFSVKTCVAQNTTFNLLDYNITNIPEGSDDTQTKTYWNHELTASLTYSLF